MGDRFILGIDPGPETSGMVLYRLAEDPRTGWGRVIRSRKDANLVELRAELTGGDVRNGLNPNTFEVVLECTQAGPPSTAVVKTTEVVGRLMEACDTRGIRWHAYYRREVLQALDCAKKGNKDALVRAALIEIHGGTRQAAIGTKKSPGPLYGVSSHAWQALGVVAAHLLPF